MYVHVPAFIPSEGLELGGGEEDLTHSKARKLQNLDFLESSTSNAITVRNGHKHVSSISAGLGLGRYVYGNKDTGSLVEEVVAIGAQGYTIETGTFTITYTGVETGVVVNHYVMNGTWTFSIYEGSTEVLSYDCGIGFDEATPKTLANLKTAIDALTDYSAAIVGDSAQPCAYLPTLLYSAVGTVISYSYPSQIRQPQNASNPFATTNTNRNQDAFELASFVNVRNVLLISTGYDELQKYDGNKIYRAGLPQAVIDSATPVTGAASLTGTYEYLCHYRYIDAQGNTIEGSESNIESASPSAEDVDVTFQTIEDTSGFDTDMAVVNGAQVGVTTITVNSGHGLQAGDTVFLLDTSTSSRVAISREITSTTATTVTITGAAVNVSNGAFISCLAACLYRDKGGALFYELAVLPVDTSSSTQVFRDTIADANLGASYTEQVKDHDLPPKGKYLTVQGDSVVMGGVMAEPNTVYWSDIDGPEYYPPENSLDIYSASGGVVTGVYAYNDYLIIGCSKSLHLVKGSLVENRFNVDVLSNFVGCVSHHTFAEIGGTPNFPMSIVFLSSSGLHRVELEGSPTELSKPILSLFHAATRPAEFNLSKAIGVVDARRFKYYLYLPVVQNNGSENYHNDESEIYVFDYNRVAWVGPWTGLNFGGGVNFDQDNLCFVEKRIDQSSSNLRTDLQEFLFRLDSYSQVDHVGAIPSIWVPGWIVIPDLEGAFKVTHIKLYSTEANRRVSFSCIIKFEKDFNLDVITGEVVLSFNTGSGLGWGDVAYGAGAWGGTVDSYKKAKVPVMRSRSFRARFLHTVLYEKPIYGAVMLQINAHGSKIR